MDSKIAYKIAADSLRKCYSDSGILAGRKHFNDYWARDSFFASLGALKLRDYSVVKKNLELFLKFQKSDGQFPMRIGQHNQYLKFLGVEQAQVLPRYVDDKNNSTTTDQNSLFIVSLNGYLKKTGDYFFLKNNYAKIKAGVDWNFSQDFDNDLLIEEKPYANWMDSIKKEGKVLYTNICHWKAVELFSKMANRQDAKKYCTMMKKIKDRINELFWNGNYFVDWISKKKTYDYFSSDGNLLAVYFGFASKLQEKKILGMVDKFQKDSILVRTSYPSYSEELTSLKLRLVGMGDYHNSLYWLWLSGLACCVGAKKTRAKILNKIYSLLIRDGIVAEVYDSKLFPVKRMFYESEMPFALNASWCLVSMAVKK